ncbi:MAG TPA: CsgG/HfaB family protein, partial [bacterium]|nr:CsgG/HfaB family protein [bacterium]
MNRLVSLFSAALLLVLFSTCYQPLLAKKNMRIAVLELTPLQVAPDLATGVTDLIVTELVNCGEFEVLERMQVIKILNEQGFQQTGVTDTTKAIEAGKLLNTDTVMIGTLQQFNKSIVINVKIVDVATGKILLADKQVAERDDKLIEASSTLVSSLVSRMTGYKPVQQANSAPRNVQPAKKEKFHGGNSEKESSRQ